MRKKILWISDYSYSGYTLVTTTLIPYIKNNYDVYLYVINSVNLTHNEILDNVNKNLQISKENVILQDYNIINNFLKIKSKNKKNNNYDHLFNSLMMGIYHLKFSIDAINPDIIFVINDYYVISKIIKTIKNECVNWKGETICYMPVDAENYPKGMFEDIKLYDKTITMSENSKKQILNTFNTPYNNIFVLEHIILDKFFKIENFDRTTFLKNNINTKINKNDIIILNSNINSYRKRLDLTINSFFLFYSKYQTLITKRVFLILKTTKYSKDKNSFDLEKLIDNNIEKYNLSKQLRKRIILCYEDMSYEKLNNLYNSIDLNISTTSGEGWGLTPFELLKINKYTIVPDNTTYKEFFPNIFKCPTVVKTYNSGRALEKGLNNNDLLILLKGYRYENCEIITQNKVIEKDNEVDLLILKKSENIIDIIEKIKKSNPLIFQIAIKIDDSNNFKYLEDIMNEFKNIDLVSHLSNYKLIKLHNNCLDRYIVKVREIIPERLSEMIYRYIFNKEYYDNETLKNNKFLENFSGKIIGKKILDIIEQ